MTTGRYLTVRNFLTLLRDLKVIETPFQERLLEFFEAQRMVVPAARVRWPRSIVIEARDGVPPQPPTPEELAATEALEAAERRWRRYDAPADLIHPYDDAELEGGRDLVSLEVAEDAFEPWQDFRTNIKPDSEPPRYVPDAVDTYYHDWQALLVADALRCGIQLVFDTRNPELFAIAHSGNLGDLPRDARYSTISIQGPQGLNAGLEWAPFFDAAARLDVVRDRMLMEISRLRANEPGELTEEERNALSAALTVTATAALAALDADWPRLKAFIVYLCERWDEFQRRDETVVANEYRRQLQRAVRLAVSGLGLEPVWIIDDVGRVTGHFENTLSVVFPDWQEKARETLLRSLEYSVVALAPAASPDFKLHQAGSIDFVDWLERRDQWKVHVAVERIIEHQFQGGAIDHSALAKEVESLGTTFEHLVDDLLDEAGIHLNKTLTYKVPKLWSGVPSIGDVVDANHALVSLTKFNRAEQLNKIDALPLTGPDAEVIRTLLKAMLYRNAGVHEAGGMSAWQEDELHVASRLFLMAMLLCRQVLLRHPPAP